MKAAIAEFPLNNEGSREAFVLGGIYAYEHPEVKPEPEQFSKCRENLILAMGVINTFISKVEAKKIKSVKTYQMCLEVRKRIEGI